MNIPCPNDDEDFPVFKAGPPLPIRTKIKPNCKIKGTPLKATQQGPYRSSPKHGTITAPITTNSTESKVKQYIEKVKASDELARKQRIRPEQMLSLEELYQVNVSSESKGEHSGSNFAKADNNNHELSLTDVQDKLRETLRIVKEKDELINKLRESCHDLAIKCADAENRVDELRFSYGRSSLSVCNDKESTNLHKKKCAEQNPSQYSAFGPPRRCVSAEGLQNCGVVGEVDNVKVQDEEEEKNVGAKIDKATETSCEVMKYDAHTQIETTATCPLAPRNNDRLSEQEFGELEAEEDILQETCSNWLEKVQNWKTDSTFNLSQDSGGDKDSGFRGSSAEIDAESLMKRHPSTAKSLRKCHHGHGERLLRPPIPQRNITAQLPQMSSSTTTTITAPPAGCTHHHPQNVEEEHSTQHFWPSFSSSQSHFHLNNCHSANFPSDSTKAKSLFYEMAEADRNKYACFKEGCLNKHHRSERLGGAKSLDLLYMPPQPASHPTTEELRSLIDSSFDPPELIIKSYLNSQQRSVEKKVKILWPLLDDTTQVALRLKMKSERLAKMLHDVCTLE